MAREISPQQAGNLLRTVEAARFRQTIDAQGLLQQARGAGGVKGKLVAWVLASPGREGSFAGRSVKALVNLFAKGGFEAVSSALQGSREQSVNNLLNGVLRYGEDQLDADFNRQFSETALALAQVKGERFSATNFSDMHYALKELAGKQGERRQATLDAVRAGRPTAGMQALTADERGRVIEALSSGVDALRQSNLARTEKQLTLGALAATHHTRASENVRDVMMELSGLYRHLQSELGDRGEVASSDEYTGDNEDVRRYLQGKEEEGRALQQQLRDLRDNYCKALQTLEPAPAPAQSGVAAPDSQAQPTPAARAPGAPDSDDFATALKEVKQELGQAMSDYETLKKSGVSDTTRSNHERYVQTLGGTLVELEQAQTDPGQALDNLFADKVRREALDTLLVGAATAEDLITAHDEVEEEHSRALADFELMKQAKVGDASLKNHLYYMQDLVSTVFELKSRMEKIKSPATTGRPERASTAQTQAGSVPAGRNAAPTPERPSTVPAPRAAPAAAKPLPPERRAELEQLLSDAIQEHKRAAVEYESLRKGKFSPGSLQSQLFLMNEAAMRIASLNDQLAGKA